MSAVLNYTTTIPADRTVGEMQAMLARHGAARIAVEYADRSPVGLAFLLDTPHGPRQFTLPVDVDAMHRLLTKQDRAGRLTGSRMRKDQRAARPQAERVAWRVMKDWLAAQLALVESSMAALDQVMLPYLHIDADRTLYAAYRERETALAITAGVGVDA